MAGTCIMAVLPGPALGRRPLVSPVHTNLKLRSLFENDPRKHVLLKGFTHESVGPLHVSPGNSRWPCIRSSGAGSKHSGEEETGVVLFRGPGSVIPLIHLPRSAPAPLSLRQPPTTPSSGLVPLATASEPPTSPSTSQTFLSVESFIPLPGAVWHTSHPPVASQGPPSRSTPQSAAAPLGSAADAGLVLRGPVAVQQMSKVQALGLALRSVTGHSPGEDGDVGERTPLPFVDDALWADVEIPQPLLSRSPRRSLRVEFTCNKCGQRTMRAINPHAYKEGTVFVQCAGCDIYHKLVDNLKLFHELSGPIYGSPGPLFHEPFDPYKDGLLDLGGDN